MKPRVFLSHASEDKPIVRQIHQALLLYDLYAWLDEIELLPGDSLFGRIGNEIESADKVLAFISEASVKSNWVQRELNTFLAREAQTNQILVIPVIIDSVMIPAFLNDRVHIRLHQLGLAHTIQQILKGVFRHHAILVAKPIYDGRFGIENLQEGISVHKESGLRGELLVVFDHYELTKAVLSALIADEWGTKERVELAWHRCMSLLTSLTSRIIPVILDYFQDDAIAPAMANHAIQTIWRLVILTLIDHVRKSNIIPEPPNIIRTAIKELYELELIKEKRIPGNVHLAGLTELWLAYLNCSLDECYEIDFIGKTTGEVIEIFDATRVLIERRHVREDSLTFSLTSPASEFSPIRWVEYVLPFIVSDAIIEIGFGGRTLSEAIPRVGLRLKDFRRFGIA